MNNNLKHTGKHVFCFHAAVNQSSPNHDQSAFLALTSPHTGCKPVASNSHIMSTYCPSLEPLYGYSIQNLLYQKTMSEGNNSPVSNYVFHQNITVCFFCFQFAIAHPDRSWTSFPMHLSKTKIELHSFYWLFSVPL